jgi:hypothetical protein
VCSEHAANMFFPRAPVLEVASGAVSGVRVAELLCGLDGACRPGSILLGLAGPMASSDGAPSPVLHQFLHSVRGDQTCSHLPAFFLLVSHSGISVNIQDLAPSCAGFLFGENILLTPALYPLLASRAVPRQVVHGNHNA